MPDPTPWTTPNLRIIWAGETLPAPDAGPSLYLDGPIPVAGEPESWRTAAMYELSAQWPDSGPRLTVITPEPRTGIRPTTTGHLADWASAARATATMAMTWHPHEPQTLPDAVAATIAAISSAG